MVVKPDPSAPLQRLRLRRMLQELRAASGSTQAEVATALCCAPSKVARVESGQSAPSYVFVKAMLSLYGVTDNSLIDAATQMVQVGRRQPWLSYRHALTAGKIQYLGLESLAERANVAESFAVPELLQTEEYARLVIEVTSSDRPDLAEPRLQATLEHQELLANSDRPELTFLLEEPVLYRAPADMMARQVEHLSKVAMTPRVSVGVVPLSAGFTFYDGMNSTFATLEITGQPEPLLYVQLGGVGLVEYDEPDQEKRHRELKRYRARWDAGVLAAIPLLDYLDNTYATRAKSRYWGELP